MIECVPFGQLTRNEIHTTHKWISRLATNCYHLNVFNWIVYVIDCHFISYLYSYLEQIFICWLRIYQPVQFP